MSLLSSYRASLELSAIAASPGLGLYKVLMQKSLPWIGLMALLIFAALVASPSNGLSIWLIVAVWMVPIAGWLFVNIVMLAAIFRNLRKNIDG